MRTLCFDSDDHEIEARRYQGLRFTPAVEVTRDSHGLIVKPAVVRAQIDREIREAAPEERSPEGETPGSGPMPGSGSGTELRERVAPKRFHATATLNHSRIGPDAGRIAEEVVSHLDGLVGSDVTVTLEIEVTVPTGVPERVERVVTENSSSLRLDSHAFEDS